MNKIITLIVSLFVFSALAWSPCYGFWIWSPKTGKWINPAYHSFDTPKEQFEWAKGFFDDNEYRRAMSEFKKVLKKFPNSSYAAEAQFYIGICYEKLNSYYNAFLNYQKVVDTYPLNEHLEEIVEKQYLIGEKFFNLRKYERAKQIFSKALNNAPYSKVSDVIQYNIGLCCLRMHQYAEARDEFEALVENYSFSPYVDDATYQIGFCSFKISSLVKDYDMDLIDKAVSDLGYFLRRFKTSVYVNQAESLLNKLKNRKAERFFNTAYFYEKQRKDVAAIRYYEELVYNYEKTSWAKKAAPRLKRLR